MKKLLLRVLAFHAAAAAALAQSPTLAPPAPKVVADAQSPAAAAARTGAVKVEPAKLFPEEIFAAELKDLYDVSFSLGEYRGRVFVLNFWASWCGPCRSEIPELNKLREEYAPRGVEFVGLTVESPGAESEKVREFAHQSGMEYRVGWADPDVAAALMNRRAIPQTLVVAADGRIVARFVGYSKRVSQMLRAGIERALEPPPEEAEPAPGADSQPPPAAAETSKPPRA
jgi:thiol-disulfide isomerase/thioredoxin